MKLKSVMPKYTQYLNTMRNISEGCHDVGLIMTNLELQRLDMEEAFVKVKELRKGGQEACSSNNYV